MKTWISACVLFAFVLVGVFFLAGLFLMPHRPPVPRHHVTAFEAELRTSDRARAPLGLGLGIFSARQVSRSSARRAAAAQCL